MSSRLFRGRDRLVISGALLAIFMLGMALRLYQLDADSLWLDEISTSTRAQLDLPTLLSLLASGEGRGVQLPLTYVVSHFFVTHFGTNEFVLRLPAVLLGSLSVLLIYKVGEMLWSRDVGLVGALLLAINPYHVQYSQEARHYALMVFLAMTSLIFLIMALKRRGPMLWLGFVLSTSLGLYNHYFAFLFLAAELFLAAWLIGENWRLRRRKTQGRAQRPPSPGPTPASQLLVLSVSLVVVGASLLPWASPILGVVSSPAGSGETGFSLESVQSSSQFIADVLISFSGVEGLGLAIWIGLFALGLARSSARSGTLVLLGIGIPLVFLTLMGPSHQPIPKYILFWLPLYLLSVARGLLTSAALVHGHLLRPIAERKWSLATTQALIVFLFATLSVAPIGAYYRWDREDWRGAAAYLQQNMGNDDFIVTDGQGYGDGADAHRTSKGLAYYLSPNESDANIFHAQRGLSDHVQQLPDSEAQVWGVLWHFDELPDWAELRGKVEILELPSVAVVTLTEPQGSPLDDTLSILEAMALIQPRAVGRFDLHLALSELYLKAGMPAEAALQVRLAGEAAQNYADEVALDPTRASRAWDWRPYWDLGSTYEELGMLQEAADAFQQVLKINPEHLPAYLRLAEACTQLNEPAQALAAYQQALELEPENPELQFLLGEAYQGLGRIDEAIMAYRKVLSTNPEDEWAKTRLTLLSQPTEEEIPHPLLRSMGLQVALLGYDLHPATLQAGGTLDITLWWQELAPMDCNYSVFIHLTGPDGRVLAQSDTLLLHGQQPTSGWRLGLVAKTDSELHIPHDAPPGEYTIMIGVYSWESGERLPVWDERGKREPADAIALSTVTVTKPPDAD
jgi:mannosyltransferase